MDRSAQSAAIGRNLFDVVNNCVAGKWRTLKYIGTWLTTSVESQSTNFASINQHIAAQEVLALYICHSAARWKGREGIDNSNDDLDHLSGEENIRVDVAFQHLSIAERQLLLGNAEAANEQVKEFLNELRLAANRLGAKWNEEQEHQLNQNASTLTGVLDNQLEVSRMVRFGHIPKRLTFLLGMHRSGTSALAGALCKRGFAAPTDPLPANPGNSMGYFESKGLVTINDKLLADFGLEWKSLTALPDGWTRSEAAKIWRRRVINHLAEVFEPTKHALIKDPRLNILFSGLSDWYECMDINISLILQMRHPYECASSLQKLRNIPIADGLRLWSLNVITAERSTRGMERMITTYEELLFSPEQLLERICTRFLIPHKDPT